MRNRRWIFWLIGAANVAALAWYIRAIPQDVVAVHYNIFGEADRWGSKWALGFIGAFPPLLLGVYELYRKLTVNNARIMANRRYEDRAIPWIAMLFVPLSWVLVTNHGERLSGGAFGWLCVIMGALMVFLSNMMGKISPNRTFGYRLPWTLKDDEVWRATHRLAGYWGVAGGAIMIVGGFAALRLGYGWAIGSLMAGLLVLLVPPAVFAYRMYHRIHG